MDLGKRHLSKKLDVMSWTKKKVGHVIPSPASLIYTSLPPSLPLSVSRLRVFSGGLLNDRIQLGGATEQAEVGTGHRRRPHDLGRPDPGGPLLLPLGGRRHL